MSVGNYGAVKNQLEQLVAIDIDPANLQGSALGARSNQGVAILPSLIHQVLARPDFANTLNAKIATPTVNTSSGVDVSTTAANVIAVVYDNSQAATDAYLVFFGVVKASVTLGTTNPSLSIYVKANTQGCVLFPQPPVMLTNTGLSWDSTTNIYAGATRSTAATVTVLVVYTK